MTVVSFSGGAGCGKTFQLMAALSGHLHRKPLQEGQKVLALTYMHGSRRRLHERLDNLPGLARKHECTTVDSFALRIVRRWQALLQDLGYGAIAPEEHDQVVRAAAAALEQAAVCQWVASSFPVMLVDEAQDLTEDRVRIVAALAAQIDLFAAADEFQCLEPTLRPNPAVTWLTGAGEVRDLTRPQRTDVQELLDAAALIRQGKAPESGDLFKIQLAPKAAFAGTWATHAIAWYGQGKTVAVIAPAFKGYADSVVKWMGANTTKRGIGPIVVPWEKSDIVERDILLRGLRLPAEVNSLQLLEAMHAMGDHRSLSDVKQWIDTQRRSLGRSSFSSAEVEEVIRRSFSNRKRGVNVSMAKRHAMSIHGAKNREFDNVIVLWPAGVVGDADQQRRLLYNAITRARHRCLVLVQTKDSMDSAPFV